MKLDKTTIIRKFDVNIEIKLMQKLPSFEIFKRVSILIIKHNNDYYALKIRPSYEDRLRTEEFDYYKKSDILYEDLYDFCKKITGGFIIFDITGFKLD